ncbi:hypothetical protein BD410DRAFT_801355 [Rickenella mellea]|uniref:Uncharacterized protein n=1 Tax=Rickenella mellea TaxID=50990 RepID=A0A4Y7QEL1_9AGAM|nr:hypothetical protein BD410DRAFT_801355 [Rickenella mellea]
MSDISQLSLEDCADGKFYSLPVAQIQGDDTLGSAQPLTLRGDREPPGYTFETIHTHEMRKLNIHGRDIQRGSWSSEGIAIVTGGSLMDGFEHVEQEEVSSIARESTADFCSLRAVVTSKSLSYPFDEYERENRFRRPLNRGSMESTKRCVGDWTPPMTSRKTVTRYRGALSTVSPFPFNSAPGSYRGERRKSWSGALPSIEHVAQANREPFHQSQAELRLKIYASAVSAPP